MFSTVIVEDCEGLVDEFSIEFDDELVDEFSIEFDDELVELDEFSVFVDDCSLDFSVVFSTIVVLVEDGEAVVGLLS
ncbi:hypothetical protein SINDD18_00194 [Streptococcus infantis]|uniref:Uncharacterized protein n=1 Tax=Streptococcus infantis TaxID=68892 RepID=A0A139RJH3_9STRE|nr:hypothetical protein SINDD18_00194 [Streptococcus infantis]